MKKIIEKTEAERKAEETRSTIKVSETHFYYWACGGCCTAYFNDDLIIKSSDDGNHSCPRCGNHIFGGDEKTFNKYYKLAE